MLYQPVNPFPPTENVALAITNIGVMFVHFFILVMYMVVLFRLMKNDKLVIPFLITYMFSLLVGVESLYHSHLPFSPTFEIFFLTFQTGIFITYALENYKIRK